MKYVFTYILLVLYVNGFVQELQPEQQSITQIEKKFAEIGLRPAFHNYYLQHFPVYQDSLNRVLLTVGGIPLKKDTDFIVTHNSTFNVSFAASEVLFVGYGLSDSTRDDYKDVNARGKIVMVFPGAHYKIIKGKRVKDKIPDHYTLQQAAQKNGAIALLITDKNFPRQPDSSKGPLYIKDVQWEGMPNTFIISDSVGRQIMGTDYYIAQRIMKNNPPPPKSCYLSVMLELDKLTERKEGTNVVGKLEGSSNKDECVLIYAPLNSHYTDTLLDIAGKFANAATSGQSNQRTILFAAAFEGNLGKEYLLKNSPVPSDKIKAVFNLADTEQPVSYEEISRIVNADN